MSSQEILEKAIQRAIDGGFEAPQMLMKKDDYLSYDYFTAVDGWFRKGHYDESDKRVSLEEVIFNHGFLKALFPGGSRMGERGPIYPWWKYHAQKMVIAEDPIKYLGENMV